jgi:hypothetical protein
MIVMGTLARMGLQHVQMGSVAEADVRRALCPVLTIHLPILSGVCLKGTREAFLGAPEDPRSPFRLRERRAPRERRTGACSTTFSATLPSNRWLSPCRP